MGILDPSTARRLQAFFAAGGCLLEATKPAPTWLVDARADYDARHPNSPRESRILKALHAPEGDTLIVAFDADGILVGAMSYRVRQDPTDLFVTSIGSTGALRGTGVGLLAYLASVSLDLGHGVRASVDPIATSFYESLGWTEIIPGDPGHKWRWPLAARTTLASLALPAVPEPGL